jgi:hypothetical protein
MLCVSRDLSIRPSVCVLSMVNQQTSVSTCQSTKSNSKVVPVLLGTDVCSQR